MHIAKPNASNTLYILCILRHYVSMLLWSLPLTQPWCVITLSMKSFSFSFISGAIFSIFYYIHIEYILRALWHFARGWRMLFIILLIATGTGKWVRHIRHAHTLYISWRAEIIWWLVLYILLFWRLITFINTFSRYFAIMRTVDYREHGWYYQHYFYNAFIYVMRKRHIFQSPSRHSLALATWYTPVFLKTLASFPPYPSTLLFYLRDIAMTGLLDIVRAWKKA